MYWGDEMLGRAASDAFSTSRPSRDSSRGRYLPCGALRAPRRSTPLHTRSSIRIPLPYLERAELPRPVPDPLGLDPEVERRRWPPGLRRAGDHGPADSTI